VSITRNSARTWFTAALVGSFLLMALHLAMPLAGPGAYGYFGAAELVALAQAGSPVPALLTIGVAALLGVAGLFALSGARRFPELPLRRPALAVIGGIFTLRGLLLVPELASVVAGSSLRPPRALLFSAISLSLGLCVLAGLRLDRARSKIARGEGA
jgi:hypothetical protein